MVKSATRDAGRTCLRLSVTATALAEGSPVRGLAPAFVLVILSAGCGTASQPPPSPTAKVAAAASPTARVAPSETPTPTTTPAYRRFLTTLCSALAGRDATTVQGLLPYYQYNNGVRYGWLGDGEGQTADPSILASWLNQGNVRCTRFTPDIAGHGTVLTSGWSLRGGWSLIEMDIYGGAWKINDFTFGDQPTLAAAMRQAYPDPELYRG